MTIDSEDRKSEPVWETLFARVPEGETGQYSFSTLLEGMTPAHLHQNIWANVRPVGQEVW